MTQTATNQFLTSAQLFDRGASAPAGNGYSYMPVGGLVGGGAVELALPIEAQVALADRAKKAAEQSKLKHTIMPTGMARRTTPLLQRGYTKYGALHAAHAKAHSAKPTQALKAPMPTQAPAPKVQPKPAMLALPLRMTMSVGQMTESPAQQQEKARLRLVASNETAPKPKAQTAPNAPSAFSRRHEKLCQGMGAFNFG
jgi:hypothetical protein